MMLSEGASRFYETISQYESVAVSFSGGLNSAYLLATASRLLPGRVLAVTFVTPFIARSELIQAEDMVRQLRVLWQRIPLNVLSDDRVSSNSTRRCYWCKRMMYRTLKDTAEEAGIEQLVDGLDADDVNEPFFPELDAAAELGIAHPIADAGMKKADVIEDAMRVGLGKWNTRDHTCLARHFPRGQRLTKFGISRAEEAEKLLAAYDLGDCRLRHHGNLVRLEASPEYYPRILAQKDEIYTRLKKLGIQFVCLDLAGDAAPKYQ